MSEETIILFRPAGSRTREEFWIPTEDLEEFNRNLVGKIEVIAEFIGK